MSKKMPDGFWAEAAPVLFIGVVLLAFAVLLVANDFTHWWWY